MRAVEMLEHIHDIALIPVTICIPVYNGGSYLRETLESLVAQTHKNIEIIVSDNASTDNSCEIVQQFQARDPRITLIKSNNNIGYCANTQKAIQAASNEYIAIYHADDIYSFEIIQRELSVLINFPEIAGVFSMPYMLYSPSRRAIKKRFHKKLIKHLPFYPKTNLIVGNYQNYISSLIKYGNFFACPSFMTKKSTYLKTGGFTERYQSCEDIELWLKYLQGGHKLAIINDFLFTYRVSENQESAHWRRQTSLGMIYNVYDDMIFQSPVGLTEFDYLNYQSNKAVGYARAAFAAYVVGDTEKMCDIIRSSRQCAVLPLFSPFGMAQRFPRISFFIKSRLPW